MKVHDRVTTHRGSQQRTLANITTALAYSIPVRVGIIEVFPDQEVAQTEKMLRTLGVERINIDFMRGVGRGLSDHQTPESVDSLCGHCWSAKAMVDPNGWVYPCVFSRWLKIGNVRSTPLTEIVTGETMKQVREGLKAEFELQPRACLPSGCNPQFCMPNCNPAMCSPVTQPPRPPSPCPPRS